MCGFCAPCTGQIRAKVTLKIMLALDGFFVGLSSPTANSLASTPSKLMANHEIKSPLFPTVNVFVSQKTYRPVAGVHGAYSVYEARPSPLLDADFGCQEE